MCVALIPLDAQEKRYHVLECLDHPYLDEGRLRYHSCMCSCCGPDAEPPSQSPRMTQEYACHTWEEGVRSQPGFRGASNPNLEPVAPDPFQHTVEDDVRAGGGLSSGRGGGVAAV